MSEQSTQSGAQMIAAERKRQVEEEGYTAEHDGEHYGDELCYAAISYATPPADRNTDGSAPLDWPWMASQWKPCPQNRVRELVKAGALIAAEIDRLQRQNGGAE